MSVAEFNRLLLFHHSAKLPAMVGDFNLVSFTNSQLI